MNNTLENLRWATYAEQVSDKRRHGRMREGEHVGTAKLTGVQVAKILELIKNGIPQRQIAAGFAISRSAVGLIAQGRRWKHLQ